MPAQRAKGITICDIEGNWKGLWERNHRALTFYARQGFADVSAHEFVLGRDVQVDRLMARVVG
ncbi:hypothetical protein BH23ACI1_BH23ACI1_23220 [soil metagenome]|nr:hypothetical protein [Acidobacteriota bacterium]